MGTLLSSSTQLNQSFDCFFIIWKFGKFEAGDWCLFLTALVGDWPLKKVLLCSKKSYFSVPEKFNNNPTISLGQYCQWQCLCPLKKPCEIDSVSVFCLKVCPEIFYGIMVNWCPECNLYSEYLFSSSHCMCEKNDSLRTEHNSMWFIWN